LTKVRNSKLPVLVAGIAVAMPAVAQDSVEPADTEFDRMPVNTIIPEYPEKARLERIEGKVQVCFDISREGFPQRVKVRRSTHRYFEKPARDAVRRSTWRPIPHGQKVPGIKACRTFRFTLEPVPLEERD
jgi:TonB family protein